MSEIISRNDSDGASSKASKAVVIAISKPASWKSPFKPDTNSDVKNLSFDNIFVYNFFTLDERTRYSFRNPSYKTTINSHVDTAIKDITGKKVRGRSHFDRVASDRIPSYIRLSWEPPPNFRTLESVADQGRINAFKYLGGLTSDTKETYQIQPISQENFELQQQDYTAATNEFLDMFSYDPLGSPVNSWFADEVDATHFPERLGFLYTNVVGEAKYKNFSGLSNDGVRTLPNVPYENLNPGADNNGTSMPVEDSVVQVYDSALLEDLNFPTWSQALPEDTTIVLNTDYAWAISQASSKASGLLLGMQSRVRNIRYWQEALVKAGIEKDPNSSVNFNSVLETSTHRVGPMEHLLNRAHPHDIEDLNRHAGQDDLVFKLVGFVIEKTQRVETEKTTTIDGVVTQTPEEDEVRFVSEKFPLIFVPCTPDSAPVTSYIDAAVNYDKEYDYTVRAVFSFSLDVPVQLKNETRTLTFHYFMNSPYSTVLTVETREVVPPPYPRDVWAFHEYYTADTGALALHWAFPVHKQRDVTYFAIFRRKSIYEPFRLLQVYDFNYSITDPDQSAREIKAKIFDHDLNDFGLFAAGAPNTRSKIKRLKASDPKTMFRDTTFKPNTDYIYAVCAIDAHGQMSNYSSQLKVRLDTRSYKLDIRQISPPGAPLVLPNFFIKGKAFEDVARTANYRKATLRFRPDYKSVKIDDKVKKIVNAIDKNDGGDASNCYFLQIINPDRANDIVLKYQINDVYSTDSDDEQLAEVARLAGLPKGNLKN